MNYINEYISEKDWVQYGLDEICEKYNLKKELDADWTVDKQNNSYLRLVFQGRFEDTSCDSMWHFFWNGNLYILHVKKISGGGKRGGDRFDHKRIEKIVCDVEHDVSIDELKKELKSAFEARKGSGVYSTAKNYTLTLEFDKEI